MDAGELGRLAGSVAAGYLLGSVPFAYLAARAAGVDIFRVGTGNPGASNIFRNVSRRYGAFVFLADILKGVGAVLIARAMGVPAEMASIAGAAAVAGHWYPVFLRFRGGAGLATAAGAAVSLSVIPGAVALAVGIGVLSVMRDASRSATLALVALIATALGTGAGWPVAAGAAGLAALVFGRHLVVQGVRGLRAEKPGDG